MFYLFFERRLVPTLFLILGWGYQPERLQANLCRVFSERFSFVYMRELAPSLSEYYLLFLWTIVYQFPEWQLLTQLLAVACANTFHRSKQQKSCKLKRILFFSLHVSLSHNNTTLLIINIRVAVLQTLYSSFWRQLSKYFPSELQRFMS